MTSLPDIAAKYASGQTHVDEAEGRLRTAELKTRDLTAELHEAKLELDRLLDLEQQDHIHRILEGEATAPKRPKRLTRIANLQELIAGIELALPIHGRKVDEARAAVASARKTLGEAVLPDIISWKSQTLDDCAAPVRALFDRVAEVAAIDAVERQLTPIPFRISDGIDPSRMFSGRNFLSKFRDGLPVRLANLAPDKVAGLDEAIDQRTREILSAIGA